MFKALALLVLLAFATPSAQTQTPQSIITNIEAQLAELRKLLGPTVITVQPTDDVQAIVDTAPDGAVIALVGGQSYPSFRVRRPNISLVPALGSVGRPLVRSQLFVDSANVTVVGLEIGGADVNDVVICSQLASSVVFDGILVKGSPVTGAKRGIALNCANAVVRNSRIENIWRRGQDSTGIGIWDSPGPITLEHNWIDACSINILIGGVDPSVDGLVPTDITVFDNDLVKSESYRTAGCNVKNLFELKNARNVRVLGNRMKGSWTDGQQGYGVVLTVRNQDGRCPWCTLENIQIIGNQISDVGAGFNILGLDNIINPRTGVLNASVRAKDFLIENNDLVLCSALFSGAGRTFYINNGPDTLHLVNNRVTRCAAGGSVNSFLYFDHLAHQLTGLVVQGNLFQEGSYGIFGQGASGIGLAALTAYAPMFTWSNNTVVKYPNGRTIRYPLGTIIQQ